jgi:hypothetical protein
MRRAREHARRSDGNSRSLVAEINNKVVGYISQIELMESYPSGWTDTTGRKTSWLHSRNKKCHVNI